MPPTSPQTLPVIDIADLFDPAAREGHLRIAGQIRHACRDTGFFYISGHGIDAGLLARLDHESRRFFARPLAEKMAIDMARGGRAWRGYFPVGGELTSGRPDSKEGLYLGTELPADDPRVVAGWPLHGANLWPPGQPQLREAATAYLSAATRSAHALISGVALSLDLDAAWFERHYTREPTVLFRIFRYPPQPPQTEDWGVGEHTDYGLLTLLAQDECGGLQVRSRQGWIEAPPLPGTLVCNIGDMLDRLTGGVYRSTPHRVLNRSGRERLSFPLFFDPDFSARVAALPGHAAIGAGLVAQDRQQRWDGTSVHLPFEGSYGDYLLGKVGKVFPALLERALE